MSHPHPELSAPAPLAEGGLRIIPLGGLGEVGRNMTVFEYDDRLLVVDCGVLFPEDHHPGVDLILPDFDSIRDRLDAVMGVPNYGATTAKAGLQLLGVLDNRNVRGPLVPLDDAEVEALRTGLAASGLL